MIKLKGFRNLKSGWKIGGERTFGIPKPDMEKKMRDQYLLKDSRVAISPHLSGHK